MIRRLLRVYVFAACIGTVVAIAGFWVWRGARQKEERARMIRAIESVIDTTRDRGWLETFSSGRLQPLTSYDPRWRRLFGRLLVDSRRGAIGDRAGGWTLDAGDDYAFRAIDVPMGSVEITIDGWWNGEGSIGVQGAVDPSPPHRLYEATLWRRRLTIIYFYGPTPMDFEVLAESTTLNVHPGYYRIVFRIQDEGATRLLKASLRRPQSPLVQIAEVTARDTRLQSGGQGIGILSGGNTSFITGIAVRALSATGKPASDN